MARILDFDSTICAIATGNGGAIGVIRMSGKESITICDRVFRPINKSVKLLEQPGYSIVFGSIVDGEEVIDEVLVSLYRAPHSYTGEDSVEISCHASKYIERRIMEVLIGNGATMARPGEFTQRAFMNGKLDLSQAEAVADVIASESKLSHKIAMNQMRGAFSAEIKELRSQLLHFASLIELELDFNEEDVQFADREELMALAQKTLTIIKRLTDSFSLGNVIKNGVPVAIVGNPNTGKSTLLNMLLGDDKALVSDIPGTTRDSIEDVAVINGVEFRFIDTAGIRETTDIVENMGINRTREKIDKASVVIVVCDINADVESTNEILRDIRQQISVDSKRVIVFVNKIDKASDSVREYFIKNIILQPDEKVLYASAKTGEGVDMLEKELNDISSALEASSESVIVSNARHYESLMRAQESLERVVEGLSNGLTEDLIAIDINQTNYYLGEITGEITPDEILGNVFKNFCIGK